MGIFDSNIHMNGAGTTYQSFLDLADEAEQKGGKIGDRTVRLVKAGDGLATTTSHGTTGARADQIGGARKAFLDAIAKEFGYTARSIAEKTLSEGGQAVPLTARTIRAVNQALGDTGALAKDNKLVLKNKTDFDLAIAAANYDFGDRMGVEDFKIDCGRVQTEALKLIREGKITNDKDGLMKAVREVVAPRVAVAMRIEAKLRDMGVPEYLVRRVAAQVLDEAVEVLNDYSFSSGKAVVAKLNELALKSLTNGQDVFDRDAVATTTVDDAEKLLKTMFGDDIMTDVDACKAINKLKDALEDLKDKNLPVETFKTRCAKAVSDHVKTLILRMIGAEMMLPKSDNPAYGRIGSRFYDAFGVKKREVTDYTIWSMKGSDFTTRYDLEEMGPAELRSLAAKVVFQTVALDCAKSLPGLENAHPLLAGSRHSIALTVASDLRIRFEEAVTEENFARLAADYKTQFAKRLDEINTTFKNIDQANAEAKAEAEKQLEAIAAEHGIQLTPGIRTMLEATLSDATAKLQHDILTAGKAFSADECRASLLGRVESKFLEPCRKAAAEIEASALGSAQKKAFLAKVMAVKIDLAHIKMAIRTVTAFDGGALSGAVKAGDGAKLVNELFRFVTTINSAITAQDEKDAIYGSEDYTAFVTTSTDLLFTLNPEIAEGVRNLDADAREKLFDAAGGAATAKSAEIQKLSEAGGNDNQALRMEAKHWSSASSCIMQLRQEVS